MSEKRGLKCCPKCNGTGNNLMTGFIDYSNGTGEFVERYHAECYQCSGVGLITLAQEKQMRIGEYIRQARIEIRVRVCDAARFFGISMSEYSDLEHGRFGFRTKAD